jgi:hypothetical protein
LASAALWLLPASFAQDPHEEESGDEVMRRELYLHEKRSGGPGRTIPAGAYERSFEEKRRMEAGQQMEGRSFPLAPWTSVNPSGMFYQRTAGNYIAGRTNVVAFHPTDPNTFYCGAAGGGVWKTTNGGVLWTPLTESFTSLTCGGLAVDPVNPNVVYYGTGEQNYSLDSYYGDGLYKSTNGGTSWTRVATTGTVGSYISQITIDPSNTSIVYVSGSLGVVKSTNGGVSWSSTGSGANANCVLIDPTNPQVLYCTTGGYSANLVRKSTNGGGSWTTLAGGLPASGTSRAQLAMAPSNASILYASIASSAGYGLLGLYRTTNAGAAWTTQASSPNYLGSQGWYDNTVTVHPTNPDFVVVGGIDIYTSSNAGVTLTQRTFWSTTNPLTMSHADIHFLGYRGSVLSCGSDGGVYYSTNDGVSWADLNATMSTLQYQSADYDAGNLLRLFGGCQDNDHQTTTNGGITWIQRTTGDGGYSIIDPTNGSYVYGQYVNGSLKRSTNAGVSFTEIRPTGSTGGLFYNPYEMAPGDPNTVVFGRADVWKTAAVRTATSASGWTQIATTGTVGGSVSAIGISHTNTSRIYIGTSNGRILATTNNGASWTVSATGLPYVSDLAVDNANDAVCYATHTGFTTTHVRKTTNGGTSWTNITTNLPNTPANSIVVLPTSPRMLFVGTDIGVFQSTNDGTSWVSFSTGLPAATVYDLKYHEGPKRLLAATHGRGVFLNDLSSVLPVQLARFAAEPQGVGMVRVTWTTLTETNNYGFEVQKGAAADGPFAAVRDGFVQGQGTTTEPHDYAFVDSLAGSGDWWYRLKQIDLDGSFAYSEAVGVSVTTGVGEEGVPAEFSLEQNYPNPFNPVTTIEFALPEPTDVRLEVFTALGEQVAVLAAGEHPAGKHRVRLDASGWGSGMYMYRLRAGDRVLTRTLVLLK